MQSGLPLFPQAASTTAGQVDALTIFLVAMSAFFSLLIAAAVIYCAVRFRRRSEDEIGNAFHANMLLEITWTIIPTGIVLFCFFWGARVFFLNSHPPADSLALTATGKQWMWRFQHPEGQRMHRVVGGEAARIAPRAGAHRDVAAGETGVAELEGVARYRDARRLGEFQWRHARHVERQLVERTGPAAARRRPRAQCSLQAQRHRRRIAMGIEREVMGARVAVQPRDQVGELESRQHEAAGVEFDRTAWRAPVLRL